MRIVSTVFFVLGIAFTGQTQVMPVMVKDINQKVDSPTLPSNPNNGFQFDGQLFFAATSASFGAELWKSDGTYEGTQMVKDISPGAIGSGPSYFIEMNGELFFMARGELKGVWKTDGTSEGTVRLKDLFVVTGGGSEAPRVAKFNNEIYFSASTEEHGQEVWKTDGTEAGTVMLKDINPGAGSSIQLGLLPHYFGQAGGVLYFTATDGATGMELWKTDGTEAGTVQVKDIRPGSANSFSLVSFQEIDGVLYFVASDGVSGGEIWKSNGTEAGTTMVTDVVAGAGQSIGMLQLVQDKLFFLAYGALGFQYYVSDGTASGTTVLSINGVGNAVTNGAFASGLFNNELYFPAQIGPDVAIWKTDGTPEGTVLVKTILSTGDTFYGSFVTTSGHLFFTAFNADEKYDLWMSDGTNNGTNPIAPTSGGAFLMEANDVAYVPHDDGALGQELWRVNDTFDGISLVRDINETSSIAPGNLLATEDHLFFVADDGDHGSEVWATDGTEGGTVMTKDIADGVSGSSPILLTTRNNNLVFSAADADHGLELWESGGENQNTQLIKDIHPLAEGSSVGGSGGAVTINGVSYFAADDGTNGYELWKSDGTAEGTQMVLDIVAGSVGSYPQYITAFKNEVYFIASQKLWKSDGTEVGTVIVKDLVASVGAFGAYALTPAADLLYLIVDDGAHGPELWRSNGTSEGTYLVKDIYTEAGGIHFINIIGVVANKVFFSAATSGFNYELWSSDGTEVGTGLVKEISAGSSGSSPGAGITIGNYLLFTAIESSHGGELWRTDGTAEGTTLVKDIFPGALSSGASLYAAPVVGGDVYFSANDGMHGTELWTTDGTAEGTKLVAEINEGVLSTAITWLTAFQDQIYFVADDFIHGKEIWRFNPSFQEIDFVEVPDQVATPTPIALSAIASSGLPVSFELVSGPATVSGNTLTLTGAGEVVVRANQAGNDDYDAATTVEQTIVFTKAEQTFTFVGNSDRVFGDDPFELSATSSSTLPVNLSVVSGGLEINAGVATITSAGLVTIRATQAGNSFFAAAEDEVSFNVAKATQTIAFDAVPEKNSDDDPFEVNAIASSGLPITFSVVSGPAALSGSTVTLDPNSGGTVKIRASQEGDANYLAAEPVDMEFEVVLIVGLEEMTNPIRVYPNPVASTLYVTLPSDNKIRELRLMDALGRSLHVERAQGVSELALPSANIKAGVMFLVVSTDGEVKVFRIIKE